MIPELLISKMAYDEHCIENKEHNKTVYKMPNELRYFRFAPKLLVKFQPLIYKLRLIGYSSEVGESIKKIIPKLYYPLYGLSFAYIGADTYYAALDADRHYTKKDISKEQHDKMVNYTIGDKLIFHTFASVLLPAMTITGIVKTSKFILTNMLPKRYAFYGSAIIGLCSIPFIIKPIDDSTEYILDKYIRPMYPVKLEHELIAHE